MGQKKRKPPVRKAKKKQAKKLQTLQILPRVRPPSRNRIMSYRRRRFLHFFEQTFGNISAACELAEIPRMTFYRWMKEDKEFLVRVNEAVSLGTGLVSDVAQSNVLEGIKRKDPMYTKYWLSHKHPDFRRPYVFKVDSDDLISHHRSTMEGIKEREIEQNIHDFMTVGERRKREQSEMKAQAFMAKWKKVMSRPNEIRARAMFEEWKKEYEKSGKKPPKLTKLTEEYDDLRI